LFQYELNTLTSGARRLQTVWNPITPGTR
jgi:hypothetical protein